jgi:ribonuclease T2
MVPFNPPVRFCLVAWAAFFAAAVPHQSRADDIPGDFDLYVLALSWSPTYCLVDDNPDPRACTAAQHGFIVHGLWPQYDRGYPEYCRTTEERWVPDAIADSMADIMPSRGLVGSEWRKHGVCSGLMPFDYFDLTREAYRKIAIPKAYRAPTKDWSSAPGAIEAAFIDANPGLKSGGIAVTCREGLLYDVRICLTKNLDFRDCSEVNRDSCRASQIDLPTID